jgi:hypothetical protein
LQLSWIEGKEKPQPQFDGAGHMQHIQRARAEHRGMLLAQVGGPVQRRPPQDIRLPQMARRKVCAQISERLAERILVELAEKSGPADGVNDFGPTVVSYRQGAKKPAPPRGHFARALLMNIKPRERAGIDINLLGRHPRSSSQNCDVASGESASGWRFNRRP